MLEFQDSLIVTVPSLYNVELYDKATGELKTKFRHAPDSFYSDIVYNSEDQPRQQSGEYIFLFLLCQIPVCIKQQNLFKQI